MVNSMTGFGQTVGAFDNLSWTIEIRSVNARGLDIRLRLPSGYDSFDPTIRDRVRKRFKRGSVSVSVVVKRDEDEQVLKVSDSGLSAAVAALETVARQTGNTGFSIANVDPIRLAAMRGVFDIGEEKSTHTEELTAAFMSSLDQALDGLLAERKAEGEKLLSVLGNQIDQIEALAVAAINSPERRPDAIKAKLQDSIDRLFDAEARLDPDRLHQEAMVLATKADIQEELDRLIAHVERARELLAMKEPVGRQLDFLSQEFNREANTLCSKAQHVTITRIGLDLKAVIDQMREQVQNVE